jgi:hypothetical protein
MTTSVQGGSTHTKIATRDDVLRILGDIDERKLLDIFALRPTVAEVEQAAIWIVGNGDVIAKDGRPLSGTPADIVEIVTANEEEEPPTGR